MSKLISTDLFLYTLSPGIMMAEVPHLINYQGVLSTPSGKLFSGQLTIQFSL